jgi:hypothetical protein
MFWSKVARKAQVVENATTVAQKRLILKKLTRKRFFII